MNCEPYGSITLDVSCQGYLEATLDFGITLIGTLRNFDFSESYAYFNLYKLGIMTEMVIDGRAGFQFESQVLQLRKLPTALFLLFRTNPCSASIQKQLADRYQWINGTRGEVVSISRGKST